MGSDLNLKRLGEGRTASVYATDDGKALKLFHKGWLLSDVEETCTRTKASAQAGIPAVNAYKTVTVNGQYGIILDRVSGQSADILLGQCNGAKRSELIAAFAETVRRIHHTRIRLSELPDQKNYALTLTEKLPEYGFGEDLTDEIRRIIRSVPEGDGYIHGDCHTGNVIMQDGAFLFSDFGSFTGRGDPALDLCCMYSHYVFLPSLMSDEEVMGYIHMSREEGRQVYDEFMNCYADDSYPATEQDTARLTAARVCLAYIYCPAIFNDKIIEGAKKIICDDG